MFVYFVYVIICVHDIILMQMFIKYHFSLSIILFDNYISINICIYITHCTHWPLPLYPEFLIFLRIDLNFNQERLKTSMRGVNFTHLHPPNHQAS